MNCKFQIAYGGADLGIGYVGFSAERLYALYLHFPNPNYFCFKGTVSNNVK